MTVYCDDGALRIRSMVPEDARVFYDTYLSYGWHPEMKTYEDYYREQGLSFIMLITGQIRQKMIEAVKKLNNNAISTNDILLMARCMKMERRGNSWNLKNTRKRDLQILKQLGFEPKMMVTDS